VKQDVEIAVGKTLICLSDLANCVAGDFHFLHFNVNGYEFDDLHASALKKYYEEASDDYDEFAEKARMYRCFIPHPAFSAERISYQVIRGDEAFNFNRNWVIECIDDIICGLLCIYDQTYKVLNQIEDDVRTIGVANFLQGRLEYWTKEKYYFNRSRQVGTSSTKQSTPAINTEATKTEQKEATWASGYRNASLDFIGGNLNE
jgi:DNA-binding ferritin-like protein